MSRHSQGQLSYLKTIPDEPSETYFERLTAQLRQALIDHPEDELRLLNQLIIYDSVDGYSEAVVVMAKRILELDTDMEYATDAYCILARMYADKGENSEAVKYYKETIRLELEESKKNGYMFDETIIELGELYEKVKDWDNALKTYDLLNNKLIRDGKESMNRLKGEVYMKQNNREKATECFAKAVDCCMKYEWVERTIGNMTIQNDIPDKHLELYKKDIDRADNKPEDALCRLGLIYQDRKDELLAMHYYTEALKLKPCFAEAYNNMAQLVFDYEGDLKKSATLLHKARECAEKEISLIEESDDNSADEINELEFDKEQLQDEEAIKAIDKKIREANTRIFHNESKTNHYEWLKSLTDLNLSRVYNKMTDFKKAAYYKQKFAGDMGFSISESDEDGDSGEETDW